MIKEGTMTTRFVSQDVDWTEAMKEIVRQKVVEPVRKHLNKDNFEISVHLAEERKRMSNRKPKFEMWVVLQTFDGRNNQIVRREGEDFIVLANDISKAMRSHLARHKFRKRFSLNPFRQLMPVEVQP